MLMLATPDREKLFRQFSNFLFLNLRNFMFTFSDFLYSNEVKLFLNLMKVYIQPPNYVLFIDFILFKVMIQVIFRKFGLDNKAYKKSELNSTT